MTGQKWDAESGASHLRPLAHYPIGKERGVAGEVKVVEGDAYRGRCGTSRAGSTP